jgi:uncharacterized protein YbjT (DUF2867 family)
VRIIVIGGTGRVGSKVVRGLARQGHDAVAAAPHTGVDTVTGAGLTDTLAGAAVVVDVSNPPSFADAAALHFFTTSTANLIHAEAAAGVAHHTVLSVVGVDRLAWGSGYFRAKMLQEDLIAGGPIPYTILRSTQFFEFLGVIAESGADGDTIRLPPAFVQPIAAVDAAEAVAIAAVGDPVGGILEVGGPARYRLDEIVRIAFLVGGDRRSVVADPAAPFWGITIGEHTLAPSADAIVFETRFEQWLLEHIAGSCRG